MKNLKDYRRFQAVLSEDCETTVMRRARRYARDTLNANNQVLIGPKLFLAMEKSTFKHRLRYGNFKTDKHFLVCARHYAEEAGVTDADAIIFLDKAGRKLSYECHKKAFAELGMKF